jgi:hypothetical protein
MVARVLKVDLPRVPAPHPGLFLPPLSGLIRMTRPLSSYQPSPDTSPMMRWSIKPLSTQSSLKPGRGGKACFACDSSCVLVSHKSCSQQLAYHILIKPTLPPPEIAPIYRSQPSLPRPSLAPTPQQSTLTLTAHWMSHSSRRVSRDRASRHDGLPCR